MLQDFLEKNQHLNVTNALPICEGKITRVRHMKNTIKESILDFFIVCDELLPLVTKMKIHEKDEIVIKRYKEKVVKTDHKMLSLELNINIHKEKQHDKVEVFNVRNKHCQNIFHDFTSKEGRFTKCFEAYDETIDVQFNKWTHTLDKSIHACFKKIRVNQKTKRSKIDTLMDEKSLILKQKIVTEENKRKVEEIEQNIIKEISEKEFEKLKTVIGEFENEPNSNMWRELRKAYPKINKPLPTGVKDIKGSY